jgi:CspA family cold shock protein
MGLFSKPRPVAPPPVTLTGVVRWFDSRASFGYIMKDGSSENIFVHHTQLREFGMGVAPPGSRVSFQIGTGILGRQAINVCEIF